VNVSAPHRTGATTESTTAAASSTNGDGAAPPVPPPGCTPAAYRAAWRSSYGPHWRAQLAYLVLVCFLTGLLRPLVDPDLPMHLALGDWIVRHRAVPVTEPFAWTRMGAPFFAYSWLPEVAYYLALRSLGPLGLHLVNGMLVAGCGVATYVLGRAAGWRPWVVLSVAAVTVGVTIFFVPGLRPQLVLLVAMPLAWAGTYDILRAERLGRGVLLLASACALAANSHLFFPVTAAPLILCWVYPPAEGRRLWAAGLAVLAGWVAGPHTLLWPRVFALNLGYNALLYPPTPIAEFQPGFTAGWLPRIFAGGLLVLPWAVATARLTRRERIAAALLWTAGLVGFAIGVRLLVVWWLLVLPLVGWVARGRSPEADTRPPRPAVRWALYGVTCLFVVALMPSGIDGMRIEGRGFSRRLPTYAEQPVEPLAVWLERNAADGSGGRIFTVFNYGSYLTWRLPQYSASIDGRTIFPDSVAKAESYLRPRDGLQHGPWRSAELAILPLTWHTAAVLDTAAGWRRVATSPGDAVRPGAGLWVNDEWWRRHHR
jgi:hypothetical protein